MTCNCLYRSARIELIKIHTRENKLTLTDDEWHCLGDRTEGYSGSDIASMTLGALFEPIRDLQAAMYWYRRQGNVLVLFVLLFFFRLLELFVIPAARQIFLSIGNHNLLWNSLIKLVIGSKSRPFGTFYLDVLKLAQFVGISAII